MLGSFLWCSSSSDQRQALMTLQCFCLVAAFVTHCHRLQLLSTWCYRLKDEFNKIYYVISASSILITIILITMLVNNTCSAGFAVPNLKTRLNHWIWGLYWLIRAFIRMVETCIGVLLYWEIRWWTWLTLGYWFLDWYNILSSCRSFEFWVSFSIIITLLNWLLLSIY